MNVIYLLSGIIVAMYFGMAYVSSVLYWYEAMNAPCQELGATRPTPFNCVRLFFLSFTGYWIATVVYFVGFFLKKEPEPLSPVMDATANNGCPPIILIHGLGVNSGSFLYFYLRLRKANQPVFLFSYSSLSGSVDKVVSSLDEYMHMVESTFPDRKPILVGHSLGGIIIRRWMQQNINHKRISGVITMGTPHLGSKLAMFVLGDLARELRPGSAFLSELNATAFLPSGPCVALVSPIDEVVLPAAALLPPEGWKLRIIGYASHITMLFCPRVYKIFEEELAGVCRDLK